MRNYTEITPEWVRDNQVIYYGHRDDEDLYEDDIDEKIANMLGGYLERPDTIHVTAFRRMKPDHWSGQRIVETILEDIDEDLGNPNGEAFEATRNMRAAADALAKVIAEEYEPWACEAVETFVVDVPAWIAAHRPDWLEMKTMSDADDAERKQLRDRIALLEVALREAAGSLVELSTAGARGGNPGLADLIDVRGYATSRSRVAFTVLGKQTWSGSGSQVWSGI